MCFLNLKVLSKDISRGKGKILRDDKVCVSGKQKREVREECALSPHLPIAIFGMFIV